MADRADHEPGSAREQAALARLPGLELNYSEVGGTRWPSWPEGYHTLQRSITLGSGSEVFERASTALLGWQVHRRAGFRVLADAPTAVVGSHVLMILGRLPVGLTVPCRVVYDVAEPDRRGFAYGTLPGHPESGEEAFVVRRGNDDRVSFTVWAFSRPGSRLARIGGPAGRLGQALITDRYLSGLKSLATG